MGVLAQRSKQENANVARNQRQYAEAAMPVFPLLPAGAHLADMPGASCVETNTLFLYTYKW
jgi:hypothetical protein